jgi:hypothetical protein
MKKNIIINKLSFLSNVSRTNCDLWFFILRDLYFPLVEIYVLHYSSLPDVVDIAFVRKESMWQKPNSAFILFAT